MSALRARGPGPAAPHPALRSRRGGTASSAISRGFLPVLALALSAPGLACRGGAGGAAPSAAAPRHYTVRAEVLRLPASSEPSSGLLLRHEAIDDFADASGRVVGMDSMAMPFPVRPGLALAGIAVGDKVQVRLKVDWAGPTLVVEEMTRLPPSTALHFGRAALAGGGGGQ